MRILLIEDDHVLGAAIRDHLSAGGHAVDWVQRLDDVLERLVSRPGAIVAKAEIEESLYAFGAEIESNAVEVYVSRLRKKLGRNAVHTVRGLGYQVAS